MIPASGGRPSRRFQTVWNKQPATSHPSGSANALQRSRISRLKRFIRTSAKKRSCMPTAYLKAGRRRRPLVADMRPGHLRLGRTTRHHGHPSSMWSIGDRGARPTCAGGRPTAVKSIARCAVGYLTVVPSTSGVRITLQRAEALPEGDCQDARGCWASTWSHFRLPLLQLRRTCRLYVW